MNAAPAALDGLPTDIQDLLSNLVTAAETSFQDSLVSIILFGSAAEARLRAMSDLNLMIVLRQYVQAQANAFRGPLQLAHVTGRATAMFVLASELPEVAEAFAVKFEDIRRRRRVLLGADVIAGLQISRAARKQRLKQVLLNLILRLRERYTVTSVHEEQLARVLADAAPALRAAAVTLLELEGRSAASPREALRKVVESLSGGDWTTLLEVITQARQSQPLAPGVASKNLFSLLSLAETMRKRAEILD